MRAISPVRTALIGAALVLFPALLRAQGGLPNAAQAQAMLQSRPELATQLRQRVISSGMTPEQIRARLRAQGYPENFLDSYLGGMPAGSGGSPSEDELTAFQRLGLTGAEDDAALRTMLRSGEDSAGPAFRLAPMVRDDTTQRAESDSAAYRLFGLETFLNTSSQFLPTVDGPVDANYRLGPGDQLVLILTGEVELAHALDVAREGFVVIPQVGQLSVAGLTMTQLENLLYSRLSRSYSGVRRGADAPTRFSISVTKLRTIQVFVTGAVARPASYRVSSAATAMTALYAAGGPTEAGTLRNIVVRRGGRVVASLDAYDYLLRGDNGNDPRLENGDLVFVAPHGPRVRVTGEVIRPATYELKAGEGVRDAIVAAGGFRPTAMTSRVLVSRIIPGGDPGRARATIDVRVPAGRVEDLPAMPLLGGDEVRVLPIDDRVRMRIRVDGHVWAPGPQGYRSGLTLSAALRAAGGLKPDAYLGQVAIRRLQSDSTRIQLRAMVRDTTGAVVEDLPLQEDDEITVYSLTEFRPERYVAIGGSVKRSGRYPYRERMTIRDLVLEAGGLTEGAYLQEAEIARVPSDRSNGVTATTRRVALDSSYVADGPPPTGPGELLEPFDNVLIMQSPDYLPPRSVVVSGEVRFPGRYTLRTKSERLSDLLVRAGGPTTDADLGAAYFARAKALQSFQASEGRESVDSMVQKQQTVERGRVGVDLPVALRRPGSSDDLTLFAEDSLHVPFRRTTVEIEGAVNAPTAIASRRGASIDYYVRAAGGASITGDARRVYVIQPNGKIEAPRRIAGLIPVRPTPRPGSTVVVPARSTENRTQERIATAQLLTQLVTSIVTAYALLR